MKVIAFAASNSRESINKKLATFTAGLIEGAEVSVLDLNDYEMPIYSVERETEIGIPDQAKAFYTRLNESDAIVISYAEHNGSFSAAYKNIMDWASRIQRGLFKGKPIIMLSTSPGSRGAATVLASAVETAPYFDGFVTGSLAVPNFHQVYDMNSDSISSPEVLAQLKDVVSNIAA